MGGKHRELVKKCGFKVVKNFIKWKKKKKTKAFRLIWFGYKIRKGAIYYEFDLLKCTL